LIIDHRNHGVVRVQVDAAILHFGLLLGLVDRCDSTVDPGRPLNRGGQEASQ
jgi:hypothetical protein